MIALYVIAGCEPLAARMILQLTGSISIPIPKLESRKAAAMRPVHSGARRISTLSATFSSGNTETSHKSQRCGRQAEAGLVCMVKEQNQENLLHVGYFGSVFVSLKFPFFT